MKVLLEKLKEHFASFANDATMQMEKGVKAAGQRARKVSVAIEKSLKEFRRKSIDVSQQTNTMKDSKEKKKEKEY